MLQIQGREQFRNAIARLASEKMNVRRFERSAYTVVNTTKGTGAYVVRFTRRDGQTFGSCTCPAGLRHHAAPVPCKHIAAAIITHNAIAYMRRYAALGEDFDNPDTDARNWQ